MLPHVIHETQSVFVPSRQILDNALLVLEIFHSMKRRKRAHKVFFALKLGMSKAHDKVEWNFLEKIMPKMGIPVSLINLIMRCVNFVSYFILINGQPSPQFSPTLGLR